MSLSPSEKGADGRRANGLARHRAWDRSCAPWHALQKAPDDPDPAIFHGLACQQHHANQLRSCMSSARHRLLMASTEALQAAVAHTPVPNKNVGTCCSQTTSSVQVVFIVRQAIK